MAQMYWVLPGQVLPPLSPRGISRSGGGATQEASLPFSALVVPPRVAILPMKLGYTYGTQVEVRDFKQSETEAGKYSLTNAFSITDGSIGNIAKSDSPDKFFMSYRRGNDYFMAVVELSEGGFNIVPLLRSPLDKPSYFSFNLPFFSIGTYLVIGDGTNQSIIVLKVEAKEKEKGYKTTEIGRAKLPRTMFYWSTAEVTETSARVIANLEGNYLIVLDISIQNPGGKDAKATFKFVNFFKHNFEHPRMMSGLVTNWDYREYQGGFRTRVFKVAEDGHLEELLELPGTDVDILNSDTIFTIAPGPRTSYAETWEGRIIHFSKGILTGNPRSDVIQLLPVSSRRVMTQRISRDIFTLDDIDTTTTTFYARKDTGTYVEFQKLQSEKLFFYSLGKTQETIETVGELLVDASNENLLSESAQQIVRFL